jgi:hypothetical protein
MLQFLDNTNQNTTNTYQKRNPFLPTMTMILPKRFASTMSLAAMLRISTVGIIVLIIFGSISLPVDAFQSHSRCLDRRHGAFESALFAARHDDDTSVDRSLPTNRLKSSSVRSSRSSNKNIDIAKIWANSLKHKIPWHAGSRQYLSDGPHPLPPSLGENENKTDHHEAAAP